MSAVGGIVLAYLAGSFPTAFLAGRVRGVDLSKVGSGNYGATNVYRNLGKGPALVVLVFDVAKGFLPVWFLPRWFAGGIEPSTYAVLLGVAAVVGHVFSIFLAFKGGKGIGTAAGVFLALSPLAAGLAAVVWFAVVGWRRIVSLASLCAALVLLIAVWVLHAGGLPASWPLVALTTFLTAFVFWTHRENIGRLKRGEEKQIRPSGPTGARAT
ncbi:MAG: glycerol-3-phosphate 1-O-acyltransferase PlsY [Gemmatimonadetes bacterium]|nr:glycerol-3-phosphate 1-O-acyltransferase PlsY [Gemmatimonadota bacterium]